MGSYPGGVPMHVRKGCEYSTTCWLCQCNTAIEKRESAKVPEKTPEIVNVVDMISKHDMGDLI
jgi:hypothetical protein